MPNERREAFMRRGQLLGAGLGAGAGVRVAVAGQMIQAGWGAKAVLAVRAGVVVCSGVAGAVGGMVAFSLLAQGLFALSHYLSQDSMQEREEFGRLIAQPPNEDTQPEIATLQANLRALERRIRQDAVLKGRVRPLYLDVPGMRYTLNEMIDATLNFEGHYPPDIRYAKTELVNNITRELNALLNRAESDIGKAIERGFPLNLDDYTHNLMRSSSAPDLESLTKGCYLYRNEGNVHALIVHVNGEGDTLNLGRPNVNWPPRRGRRAFVQSNLSEEIVRLITSSYEDFQLNQCIEAMIVRFNRCKSNIVSRLPGEIAQLNVLRIGNNAAQLPLPIPNFAPENELGNEGDQPQRIWYNIRQRQQRIQAEEDAEMAGGINLNEWESDEELPHQPEEDPPQPNEQRNRLAATIARFQSRIREIPDGRFRRAQMRRLAPMLGNERTEINHRITMGLSHQEFRAALTALERRFDRTTQAAQQGIAIQRQGVFAHHQPENNEPHEPAQNQPPLPGR